MPTPRAIAIIIVVALLATTSAWTRHTDRAAAAALEQRLTAAEPLCVSVLENGDLRGLVCAQASHALVPFAISRLGLATTCAALVLPALVQSGDELRFDTRAGHCRLASRGRLQGSKRLLAGAGIDINQDNAETLIQLPGIGAVRAQAIIESREQDGPFVDLCALDRVKGIGKKTIQRLAPWQSALQVAPRCE